MGHISRDEQFGNLIMNKDTKSNSDSENESCVEQNKSKGETLGSSKCAVLEAVSTIESGSVQTMKKGDNLVSTKHTAIDSVSPTTATEGKHSADFTNGKIDSHTDSGVCDKVVNDGCHNKEKDGDEANLSFKLDKSNLVNDDQDRKDSRRARILNSKLAVGDIARFFTSNEVSLGDKTCSDERLSESLERSCDDKETEINLNNSSFLSPNQQETGNNQTEGQVPDEYCKSNNIKNSEVLQGIQETLDGVLETVNKMQEGEMINYLCVHSNSREIQGNQHDCESETGKSGNESNKAFKETKRTRYLRSKLAIGDLSQYFTNDNTVTASGVDESANNESTSKSDEAVEKYTESSDDCCKAKTVEKQENLNDGYKTKLDNDDVNINALENIQEKFVRRNALDMQPSCISGGDFYNLEEELEIGENFDDILDEFGKEQDSVEMNETSDSKKRRKKKRKINPMPAEIAADPELRKYWGQRYRLFSKFDDGIKMDRGRFYLYIFFF